MILILSKSKFEYTTVKIMEWLEVLGGSFIRINGDDLLEPGSLRIDIDKNLIYLNSKTLTPEKVKVVFNRRWFDPEDIQYTKNNDHFLDHKTSAIETALQDEFIALSQYFKSHFSKAVWIPKYKQVNKLKTLQLAQQLGLHIPPTMICTCKDDVNKFYKNSGTLITKSIGNIFPIKNEKELISFLTVEINREKINELPNNFFPSLFQKKITKEYEIRVFYFFGKLYSMAIFSQQDKSTSIDFRNYNFSNPNRAVPCNLPNGLEKKLKDLMNTLNLNTGSIDLIKIKNKYYFLEVNPVGQFGMVAYPCNFSLHKIIAKKLIELDER